MIYLLIAAGIFGGLGYVALQRSKGDEKLYAKLATICLFALSLFALYQFIYYWQVGVDIANFGNGGAGVSFTSNVTGNTTTFLSSSDVQVGEYFAMEKANRDVIEIFSSITPFLALLLGAYLLWYYVEVGLFSRNKDRVS